MKKLQETVDFFAKYGIKSEIKGDRVVVDGDISLNLGDISTLGSIRCKTLLLVYNNIFALSKIICDIECEELYLNNRQVATLPESLLNSGIKIYTEDYLLNPKKKETNENKTESELTFFEPSIHDFKYTMSSLLYSINSDTNVLDAIKALESKLSEYKDLCNHGLPKDSAMLLKGGEFYQFVKKHSV